MKKKYGKRGSVAVLTPDDREKGIFLAIKLLAKEFNWPLKGKYSAEDAFHDAIVISFEKPNIPFYKCIGRAIGNALYSEIKANPSLCALKKEASRAANNRATVILSQGYLKLILRMRKVMPTDEELSLAKQRITALRSGQRVFYHEPNLPEGYVSFSDIPALKEFPGYAVNLNGEFLSARSNFNKWTQMKRHATKSRMGGFTGNNSVTVTSLQGKRRTVSAHYCVHLLLHVIKGKSLCSSHPIVNLGPIYVKL